MPPFCHTLPVCFADVDHAGIVYYPVFFHYFHLTFEEFFRQRLGARGYVELLDEARIGFPAVRSECDYRAPLRFGDIMDIEMSVDRLGGRSIVFRYRVYRRDPSAQGGPPSSGQQDSGEGRADRPSGTGRDGGSSAPEARSGRVLAAEGTTVCAVVDLESFRAVVVPALVRELCEPMAT
ncbi:MAG: acyl-CoA thioesterase [Proteobacteria bacterium]|nr:acyl-CoA thioesterase [Pseudomonadota bacterium]